MLWEEKRAISVLSAQNKKAQPLQRQKVALLKKLVAGVGFEPQGSRSTQPDTSQTKGRQIQVISSHSNELRDTTGEDFGQKHDTSGQASDSPKHKKCAISVQCPEHLPEDLVLVMNAWEDLPDSVRGNILKMVQEASSD